MLFSNFIGFGSILPVKKNRFESMSNDNWNGFYLLVYFVLEKLTKKVSRASHSHQPSI